MERMNLNEAELTVTTQYMIDISQRTDYNMTLSDYGDMQEFLCCCSELFPQERHPQYRYVAWDNIPSILINREWLCPNFFDIRDAFDQLDDEDMADFERWCARYGYDLRTDNPHLLVAHTNPAIWHLTWGEQIFIVFDKGQVWVNSVNDLNKRTSPFSFGYAKRNVRRIRDALTQSAAIRD